MNAFIFHKVRKCLYLGCVTKTFWLGQAFWVSSSQPWKYTFGFTHRVILKAVAIFSNMVRMI
jgi:hypothetical protein